MNTKEKIMLGAYAGWAVGCLVWVMKVFTSSIVFGGLLGSALTKAPFDLGAQDTILTGIIVGTSLLASVLISFLGSMALGVGAGAGVAWLIAAGARKPPEKA